MHIILFIFRMIGSKKVTRSTDGVSRGRTVLSKTAHSVSEKTKKDLLISTSTNFRFWLLLLPIVAFFVVGIFYNRAYILITPEQYHIRVNQNLIFVRNYKGLVDYTTRLPIYYSRISSQSTQAQGYTQDATIRAVGMPNTDGFVTVKVNNGQYSSNDAVILKKSDLQNMLRMNIDTSFTFEVINADLVISNFDPANQGFLGTLSGTISIRAVVDTDFLRENCQKTKVLSIGDCLQSVPGVAAGSVRAYPVFFWQLSEKSNITVRLN